MKHYLIIYPFFCDGCYLFISAKTKFSALKKFKKYYDGYIDKTLLFIYNVDDLIKINISFDLSYPKNIL